MSNERVLVREGSNRKSLRLKVEIFEAAVRSGIVPTDISTLEHLKDIAAWVDPQRGLTAWTSGNVHSEKGHNPDLAKRLAEARKKLQALCSRSSRKPKPLVESKRREVEHRAEHQVLIIQNEHLLIEKENFEKLIRLAKRDLRVANNRLHAAGLEPVKATFDRPRAWE